MLTESDLLTYAVSFLAFINTRKRHLPQALACPTSHFNLILSHYVQYFAQEVLFPGVEFFINYK